MASGRRTEELKYINTLVGISIHYAGFFSTKQRSFRNMLNVFG